MPVALPAFTMGAMSPPRRLWSDAWRLLLAALIGALVYLIGWGTAIAEDPDVPVPPVLIDLQLGVLSLVLVAFRRRAPLAIAVLTGCVLGFSGSSFGAFLLALVSLATRRRPLEIAGALAAAAASIALAEVSGFAYAPTGVEDEVSLWMVVATLLLVLAVPVLTGLVVGGRRALVQSLRNEAELARSERDARAAGARTAERERIARELHDELGHRLSMIAVHAGALEFREDIPPEQARAAAGVIREGAQQALADLRTTLGLLRDSGAEPAEPSPAVLERLDDLVASTRAAGTPVTTRWDGSLAELPAGIGRHLYRIVQECLTNAARHAPGEPVDLEISATPGDQVRVVVRNPMLARPGGSGYGLIGVDERARLSGGSMSAGPDGAGGFRVEVRLPWPS